MFAVVLLRCVGLWRRGAQSLSGSNEFCDRHFEGNPVVVFPWIVFFGVFSLFFFLVKGDPKQTAITGHINMIILYSVE